MEWKASYLFIYHQLGIILLVVKLLGAADPSRSFWQGYLVWTVFIKVRLRRKPKEAPKDPKLDPLLGTIHLARGCVARPRA